MTPTPLLMLIAGLALETLIIGGVFWMYRRVFRDLKDHNTQEGRFPDDPLP